MKPLRTDSAHISGHWTHRLALFGRFRGSVGWLILLTAIMVVGVVLRTRSIGSVPFQHYDDVSTARTIVYYAPSATTKFRLHLGSNPTDPLNPLTFVKAPHGPLTLMIGFLWMHIVALTGMPLDERLWHLPFALIGSLIVPTSYALGRSLRNRQTGFIAATLVALLPLHVAFSRISGEAHFILTAGLHQACMLLWRHYLAQRRPRHALATGILLGMTLLTDFFFVGILITLWVMTLLHWRKHASGGTVWAATRMLLQWRVILPLLAPLLLQGALAGYSLVSRQPVGMYGRIIDQLQSTDTQVGSISLLAPLENLAHGTNVLFVMVVVGAMVLFVWTRAYRYDTITIPLVLPVVYLLPLLVLQRERLVGHYIPVLTGLCVFVACFLDHLSSDSRWRMAMRGGVPIVVGTLFLTTLSMVYRVPVGAAFATMPEHGAIGQDYGAKAAGWWVRQNTPRDAVIYGDALANQDYAVSSYYYRRQVVALPNPARSMEESVQAAVQAAATLDYLVLGVDHVTAFPPTFMAAWEVYAIVTVHQQPRLFIYGPHPRPRPDIPPVVLESTSVNEAYDQQYAVYPALVQR
jgi:uncharacterized membrane protein